MEKQEIIRKALEKLVPKELEKKKDSFIDSKLKVKEKKAKLEDSIEVKKKAAERFHRTEYAAQLGAYKKFLNEYLKDTTKGGIQDYQYDSTSEKKPQWKWGDEVINYKERIEVVRAMMMNSRLGAPMNYVDFRKKEDFEFWKYSSKFNQLLSFFYWDSFQV